MVKACLLWRASPSLCLLYSEKLPRSGWIFRFFEAWIGFDFCFSRKSVLPFLPVGIVWLRSIAEGTYRR